MQYKSTRDPKLRFNASEVILKGISEEGGLFVPEHFPFIKEQFPAFAAMDYCDLAEAILKLYLTDYTDEEIHSCVTKAYAQSKFPDGVLQLNRLGKTSNYMLELWHGPTCAFKDMALQLLPQLLTTAIKKSGTNETCLILVATSGDTGKAALEGFRDVEGTEIVVFYPNNGVSKMQELQMVTQEGRNVYVCAVDGNFDDTQSGVKEIFTDAKIQTVLQEDHFRFSSANSINFGRLLPQVVYYFYSYFELYRSGAIKDLNTEVNIAVPTGNFGNILAAYYAYKMGLPVNRFICASNANRVLTDLLETGVYDCNRSFFTTDSPSMDILISSNFERLLFHLLQEDTVQLTEWMTTLRHKGRYELDIKTREKLQAKFWGGSCDDEETKAVIKDTYELNGYLCDTHTAVAVGVYEKYRRATSDQTITMIASTASPYKFANSVLDGLQGKGVKQDAFANIQALETISGTAAPAELKNLRSKTIRFHHTIQKDEMPAFIMDLINDIQEKD